MKNKIGVLIAVITLLLVVGYGALLTDLTINSSTTFSTDFASFNVIFTEASIDGSSQLENISDVSRKTLEFELGGFINTGDTHTLNYRVSNNSDIYDANIVVSCDLPNNINLTMTNSLANTLVLAGKSEEGIVNITLNENLLDENNFTCRAYSTPVEREDNLNLNLYTYMSENTSNLSSLNIGSENQKIYYYTGNVDNNNAIFGDLCYKIIRTDLNGDIRLIYNGIPTDGVCNNSGNLAIISTKEKFNTSNLNVSYTNEGSDSLVKTLVDTWYSLNIDTKGLSSKIADSGYCNDSTKEEIDGIENFSAFNRVFSLTPSFDCPAENNYTTSSLIGNGLLTYKVGLITSDELILAGGNNSYLNASVGYWSMSPHSCDGTSCKIYGMNEEGEVDGLDIDETYGIRPVITLNHSILIKRGMGTVNNPFILN